MLTTKNAGGDGCSKESARRAGCSEFFPFHFIFLTCFAAVMALTGCRPPGASALLDGQELLDHGQYAQAIDELKTAASLLKTNAQAWNYLAVAYHEAGQPTNAVEAYRKALTLDQNLVEVHYNLGCLWLEQNRPDLAKAELTTFTLHRGEKSPEGWIKLGEAQLRLRDLAGAEKSFNQARQFDAQSPEALNGLGLIQMQRNRPAEAAQYFGGAVKAKPDYAPGILNLAIVAQSYLNSRQYALQRYQNYLALNPRPANWETVEAAARALEQELSSPRVSAARPATPAQTTAQNNVAAGGSPRSVTPKWVPPPMENSSAPVASAPAEVEQLSPEPVVRGANDNGAAATGTAPSVAESPKQKHGFFSRINPINLFRGNPKTNAAPAAAVAPPPQVRVASAESEPPPVVVYSRYSYRTPEKPSDGDRGAAEKAFAAGSQAQQAGHLSEAAKDYKEAIAADPGYFDPYYNLGVVSARAGNLPQALVTYETALAIDPDSHDGRFNFALVLKQANYPVDAANELEKLVARFPNDPNVHYALASLYARQLHQLARAREHYQKVLKLDPTFSQASAIQDWLWANPR
jgi:tetratricopeptide (TPR) repeat protein